LRARKPLRLTRLHKMKQMYVCLGYPNQKNGFCIWIIVNKHLYKIRIIDVRPAFLNTDNPLAYARLKIQKDAANAISDIFIMFFLGTSRVDWNRDNRIADQLAWPPIKAANRAFRIIRLLIKIQHIFHVPNKIARHLSYDPRIFNQGLISFFSIAFARSCGR
jgi:hypothetical protein